jgi:hypothetical protein
MDTRTNNIVLVDKVELDKLKKQIVDLENQLVDKTFKEVMYPQKIKELEQNIKDIECKILNLDIEKDKLRQLLRKVQTFLEIYIVNISNVLIKY